EGDDLAVGRHARLRIVGRLLREGHCDGAGDRLDVDLAVTGALRVKHDRLAVGAERRVAVQARRVGEPRGVGPVGIHHVHLGLPVARGREGDAVAVPITAPDSSAKLARSGTRRASGMPRRLADNLRPAAITRIAHVTLSPGPGPFTVSVVFPARLPVSVPDAASKLASAVSPTVQ